MMDGRVKTLHPKVHGGILARRDNARRPRRRSPSTASASIDLVVVNLYPFAKAAADPGLPFDDLIEQIDIGGPSLVRAAAKNFRDVLVVVDPADYPRVLEALAGGAAAVPLSLRFELARKAFGHTAAYDRTIASTLGEVTMGDEGGTRIPRAAPARRLPAVVTRSTRRGPALRREPASERPRGMPTAARIRERARSTRGRSSSFTNLLDLDAAARIALEFDEPAAVVIKHTNPCGVATGADAGRGLRAGA